MRINNKNITKSYGIVDVVQLTDDERTELRAVTIGHGKLKAAADAMRLSRQTLYKAFDGNDLEVDTLNAIRTFLSQTSKEKAA